MCVSRLRAAFYSIYRTNFVLPKPGFIPLNGENKLSITIPLIEGLSMQPDNLQEQLEIIN